MTPGVRCDHWGRRVEVAGHARHELGTVRSTGSDEERPQQPSKPLKHAERMARAVITRYLTATALGVLTQPITRPPANSCACMLRKATTCSPLSGDGPTAISTTDAMF